MLENAGSPEEKEFREDQVADAHAESDEMILLGWEFAILGLHKMTEITTKRMAAAAFPSFQCERSLQSENVRNELENSVRVRCKSHTELLVVRRAAVHSQFYQT